MRRVQLTEAAKRQFLSLRAFERALLLGQMQLRLGDEDAAAEDRNRFRLLRELGSAAYELRVQQLRVFYRIDDEENVVIVVMIGRKLGNKLVVDDEEVSL